MLLPSSCAAGTAFRVRCSLRPAGNYCGDCAITDSSRRRVIDCASILKAPRTCNEGITSGLRLKWRAEDQTLASNLFVGLRVKRMLGVTESEVLISVCLNICHPHPRKGTSSKSSQSGLVRDKSINLQTSLLTLTTIQHPTC